MKNKILFTLLVLSTIFIVSCSEPTIKKPESIPIEVQNLEKANQFDTFLVIKTDKKCYYYDKKDKSLIGSENVSTDEMGFFMLGLLLGAFFTALIIFLIIG